MPSVANLIQTEKSYTLQQNQTFVLSFNGDYAPNKIELVNILKKNSLHPISVNIVNLPSKIKRKGRRVFSVKRPTKYYIKLQIDEKLDEETLQKIFSTAESNQ